ncbi:MAG: VCBS repeat-containing protein [Thermoplasmata archaeon]|nr:VCBS repeat-containing protein [Thermoplasmata archaeon]
MRTILTYVIGISVILSGLGIIGISGMGLKSTTTTLLSPDSFPDISAYRYAVALSSSAEYPSFDANLERTQPDNRNTDYPIGSLIWQYQISGGSDNSPKAIAAIPDINGDGIDDVVICSEDNNIRCFSGGAIGTGIVLWTHNIYSGNIYSQHGLTITEDINNDGYSDVVVGTTGGDRSIECLSGLNGNTLWTHDTHEYGGGGWVYQVNCKYDYNNDSVLDVLATTGDDSSDTGPKRVYCLNGLTGVSLWERPLGGPGFAVIGVEDFTGDGIPDVLAGCSNEGETIGYGKGINGVTGAQMWSFATAGSSVWGVEQLDDISGDGVKDVIIGDFSGHIYGLNAATGSQLFTLSIGSVLIVGLENMGDMNGDGYTDIIPEHSTIHTTQVIDGYTGSVIWSHATADQPWNVAPSTDISGDAINDVFVGTLYSNNYCYFLNGVDGSELTSPIPYGEAVDAIAAIPDVVNDGSMEMVVGGRNGKVICYSGGLNATSSPPSLAADFSATPTTGTAPLTVQFTDLSTAENTTITSWKWDFDHDGTIDSTERNPSWIYNDNGTYTVSLTISDGHISDTETKEHYITVLPAGSSILEIGNITGGVLKINAEILNKGTVNVTSVNWSITIDGKLVLLGKTKSGIIPSIPAGNSTVIVDKPVFGFGKITITITIEGPDGEPITKTVTATLLLFFIIGIK